MPGKDDIQSLIDKGKEALRNHDNSHFEKRVEIEVKGKGKMKTFFLARV